MCRSVSRNAIATASYRHRFPHGQPGIAISGPKLAISIHLTASTQSASGGFLAKRLPWAARNGHFAPLGKPEARNSRFFGGFLTHLPSLCLLHHRIVRGESSGERADVFDGCLGEGSPPQHGVDLFALEDVKAFLVGRLRVVGLVEHHFLAWTRRRRTLSAAREGALIEGFAFIVAERRSLQVASQEETVSGQPLLRGSSQFSYREVARLSLRVGTLCEY